MSVRKITFSKGEFYHIYNRGNSKQYIFLDNKDYQRFVALLYAANRKEKFNFADSLKGISLYDKPPETPLVDIGAYALMPNHFHILLTPLVENGVSLYMQKLATAYVMYFNQKNKRTGTLFEGKFKSVHVSTDRYMRYLFSYIHLNPLGILKKRVGADIKITKNDIAYLNKYSHSSFMEYIGKDRREKKILNTKLFPSYFKNKKDFLKEIKQWIKYRETLEARPKEFL